MNFISEHYPNDCALKKNILEMRMDRNMMVQTKAQYRFCLKCLNEWLVINNIALPPAESNSFNMKHIRKSRYSKAPSSERINSNAANDKPVSSPRITQRRN